MVLDKNMFPRFPIYAYLKYVSLGWGLFWLQGHIILTNLVDIKTLSLVVLEKTIFRVSFVKCILARVTKTCIGLTRFEQLLERAVQKSFLQSFGHNQASN